jgi:hypothetical protein
VISIRPFPENKTIKSKAKTASHSQKTIQDTINNPLTKKDNVKSVAIPNSE